MDSNPTFGGQELLETLSHTSSSKSQGSSSVKSPPSGGDNSGAVQRPVRNKLLQNILGGQHNLDEAYRRQGRKLSAQAHGDTPVKEPSRIKLVPSSTTSFQPYEVNVSMSDATSSDSAGVPVTLSATHRMSTPSDDVKRTSKVAKMGYSDHGEHHAATKCNILRKVTLDGREAYSLWWHEQQRVHQEEHQKQLKRQQERASQSYQQLEDSPHRFAFSQLALAEAVREPEMPNSFHHHHLHGNAKNNKGLLSAVLEGNSESTSHPPANTGHSSPTASISTKDSKSINNLSTTTPRGACLTNPSEPAGNNGLDNIEGNLIVFENDRIRIPRKSIHTIQQSETWQPTSAEFRIHSMLGQGTFAQVFRCSHLQTGQLVAVKVVKNKPAFTKQAWVEVDVFRAIRESPRAAASNDCMVQMLFYFMYEGHLCLVFELLGENLYEILKRRQFRGLPLTVVQEITRQALRGVKDLSSTNIVHCDLKPENVLLVSRKAADELVGLGEGRIRKSNSTARESEEVSSGGKEGVSSMGGSSTTDSASNRESKRDAKKSIGPIKLIDFGSACFEGYTAHTYIQSRFYRSPEVLLGIPYDSVIDVWSLGCVAAELFLGLPILPGVHEHDQLGRIAEMIAEPPDWMVDQGSKTTKYYTKYMPKSTTDSLDSSGGAPRLPQWRLKTQQEYINSLSHEEIRRKGGLSKLEKQPGTRYFLKPTLVEIIYLHGKNMISSEKDLVPAFDPWKRWTASQAMQHPFVSGDLQKLRKKQPAETTLLAKDENQANLKLDTYWEPPWDPSICRRKLLNVQKIREKQQAMRKTMRSPAHGSSSVESPTERHRLHQQGRVVTRDTDSVRTSDATSPPAQIMSSGSVTTTATTPSSRRSVDAMASLRSFQTESALMGVSNSSLVGQGHPSWAQVSTGDHMVPPGGIYQTPPTMGGPQSFSGIVDRNGATAAHNGGDFAHALQRPGFFPGREAGPSQSGSSASSHSSLNLPYGIASHSHQNTMTTFSPSVGSSGFDSAPAGQMFGVQAGSSFAGRYLDGQFGSAAPASVVPGFNVPDPMRGYQLQMPSQPQHLYSSGVQPQQQQTAFHPQQQFVANQQTLPPQVYLATTADGNQYYMTVAANGQPVILQPVTYLNQNSSNHPGGFPMGVGVPPSSMVPPPPQQQQVRQHWNHQHPQSSRHRSHHSHHIPSQNPRRPRFDRSGTSM